MNEAADRLAQGQPVPAREAQRRAADLAERGAQNAEDLAAALRAEAARRRNHAGAERRADPLADAREAMSQAAGQLGQARGRARPDPAALDAARQAMRAAAEGLQAAAARAKARGQDPADGPGEPGTARRRSSGEPKSDRAGVADPASLTELQDLVRARTGRRWGELPGHLRSEILQMSQGRYRDDYARLIQLYFREIAAGAGRTHTHEPRATSNRHGPEDPSPPALSRKGRGGYRSLSPCGRGSGCGDRRLALIALALAPPPAAPGPPRPPAGVAGGRQGGQAGAGLPEVVAEAGRGVGVGGVRQGDVGHLAGGHGVPRRRARPGRAGAVPGDRRPGNPLRPGPPAGRRHARLRLQPRPDVLPRDQHADARRGRRHDLRPGPRREGPPGARPRRSS